MRDPHFPFYSLGFHSALVRVFTDDERPAIVVLTAERLRALAAVTTFQNIA